MRGQAVASGALKSPCFRQWMSRAKGSGRSLASKPRQMRQIAQFLGLLRAEILQPINLLSRTINDSTDNDRSRQGYPSSTNYRYTDKSAFSSLETLRIGLACPSG